MSGIFRIDGDGIESSEFTPRAERDERVATQCAAIRHDNRCVTRGEKSDKTATGDTIMRESTQFERLQPIEIGERTSAQRHGWPRRGDGALHSDKKAGRGFERP